MRSKVSFQITWPVLPSLWVLFIFMGTGILPWIMANTCRPESYTVVEQNGSFIGCMDCVDCPAIYGATVPCNTMVYRDTDIACVQCRLGKTFSPENNEQQCQACKSTTCHRNEVWVGVCTLEEDKTRCTGTCTEDYHWSSENKTEPCQPLSRRDSNGDRNATKTTTSMSLAMTDNEQSPDGNVIAIVVPIAVVLIFVIAVLCVILWCYKCPSCSKYLCSLCYQSRPDDVELGNATHADDDSTNADNGLEPMLANDKNDVNNAGIQETEPLLPYSDPPHDDVQDRSPSFSETELNPNNRTKD